MCGRMIDINKLHFMNSSRRVLMPLVHKTSRRLCLRKWNKWLFIIIIYNPIRLCGLNAYIRSPNGLCHMSRCFGRLMAIFSS